MKHRTKAWWWEYNLNRVKFKLSPRFAEHVAWINYQRTDRVRGPLMRDMEMQRR